MGLIEAEGGRALAITADVTDQAAVERMVETAEQQLGPIDLLVNNAGDAQPLGAIWEVDADRWWQTIDLNVRGPFLCSRAVLKGMVSGRSGRIINLSSTAANIQTPKQTAYGVSKAALANFSQLARRRDRGVRYCRSGLPSRPCPDGADRAGRRDRGHSRRAEG